MTVLIVNMLPNQIAQTHHMVSNAKLSPISPFRHASGTKPPNAQIQPTMSHSAWKTATRNKRQLMHAFSCSRSSSMTIDTSGNPRAVNPSTVSQETTHPRGPKKASPVCAGLSASTLPSAAAAGEVSFPGNLSSCVSSSAAASLSAAASPAVASLPSAAAASSAGASSSNMFPRFISAIVTFDVALPLNANNALFGGAASEGGAVRATSAADISVQNPPPCENAAYKQTTPAIRYRQLKACSSPFFS